ncbi:MAG: YtxH domain-containing protein [Atopobiaceae bacterium]|jgi:gas vesicle protein|nr:YtxH domain-containing protein [Atopobiaceae bacterium]MCH4214069.1 YtxH domain-containing protein [Atopobiaceae bacterium]MCH4229532.1 YtxH domain-containing protein [Atopobiaceae bacterium]MCH4276421.1 YtxH domain-containing protein [Atopobiaceae bacterium]MCI1226508.1 YtxH domain-containing protein [Atopobiaceae bacterium]
MSEGNGTLHFVLGTLFGAAVGAVAGMMFAPRAGAESRAMAADAMNDAWDTAVDTYETGTRSVGEQFNNVRPSVDAKTDELRAKVDLARERMDQLRDSLSDTVATTSAGMQDAMNSVADKVSAATAQAQGTTPAEGVHIDVVEDIPSEPAEATDSDEAE